MKTFVNGMTSTEAVSMDSSCRHALVRLQVGLLCCVSELDVVPVLDRYLPLFLCLCLSVCLSVLSVCGCLSVGRPVVSSLCLFVCLCSSVCVCLAYTHTHARTHTRTHVRTHACTRIHTHPHTYTHTRTHTHTLTHTHTHTHTHTQSPSAPLTLPTPDNFTPISLIDLMNTLGTK